MNVFQRISEAKWIGFAGVFGLLRIYDEVLAGGFVRVPVAAKSEMQVFSGNSGGFFEGLHDEGHGNPDSESAGKQFIENETLVCI